MTIALVSSDFDGTLRGNTETNGSKTNLRAFTESDLLRVINSGSNPWKLIEAVNKVSDKSWNELTGPIIASGGAMIFFPGEGLKWERPISNVEKILKLPEVVNLKVNDAIKLLSKDGWIDASLRDEKENYYVVSLRTESLELALEFERSFNFPDLRITLNEDIYEGGTRIQITSKDAGKDKVIEFLRDRYGLNNEELAHLGDDRNDLPAWLIPELLSGVVETTEVDVKSMIPEPKVTVLEPSRAGVAEFLKEIG